MPESEQFIDPKEVIAAIAQLEDMFRATVDLYYDGIVIKKFLDLEFKGDVYVGVFVGEDGDTYVCRVYQEGEPTLHRLPNPKLKPRDAQDS